MRGLWSALVGSLLSVGCGELPCEKTRTCSEGSGSEDAGVGGGSGAFVGKESEGDGGNDSTEGGQGGGSAELSGDGGGRDGDGGDQPDDGTGGGATEIESCSSGELACDDECIDPNTDEAFCGAEDDCLGGNSGEECASEEACVNGTCKLQCEAGQIACDGECVEPAVDEVFCGATGECTDGDERGEECEGEATCVRGECMAWEEPIQTSLYGQPEDLLALDSNQDALIGLGDYYYASQYFLTTVHRVDAGNSVVDLIDAEEQFLPTFHHQSILALNGSGVGGLFGTGASPETTGADETMFIPYETKLGFSDMREIASVETADRGSMPGFTVDEVGNMAVSWVESRDIWVSSLDDSGEWEEAKLLAVGQALGFGAPRLHSLGAGNFLATWIEGEDADLTIWAAHSVASGTWSAPRLVGDAADPAILTGAPTPLDSSVNLLLSVSTNEAGEAIAVWVGTDGLQMNRFSLETEAWEEPVLLSELGEFPQVVLDIDGSATVSFLEVVDDTRGELMAGRLPAGDDALELAPRITGSATTTLQPPQLSHDLDGNAFLVWSESGSQATSLWSSRYDWADDSWSFPTVLAQLEVLSIDFELATNQLGQSFVVYFSRDLVDANVDAPLFFTRFR